MSNPMAGTRELRFTDFTGGTDNCLDYATHTDPSSPYYAPLGSRAEVWKDGQVYQYLVEDTGETPDGKNVIQSAADGYSGTLRWKLYGSTGGRGGGIGPSETMSNFPNGLSNTEIWRCQLQPGEVLTLYRLQLELSGGGTEANFSIEVVESIDGGNTFSQLATVTAGGTPVTNAVATTAGALVLVRATNSSGASQDACLICVMGIN